MQDIRITCLFTAFAHNLFDFVLVFGFVLFFVYLFALVLAQIESTFRFTYSLFIVFSTHFLFFAINNNICVCFQLKLMKGMRVMVSLGMTAQTTHSTPTVSKSVALQRHWQSVACGRTQHQIELTEQARIWVQAYNKDNNNQLSTITSARKTHTRPTVLHNSFKRHSFSFPSTISQ